MVPPMGTSRYTADYILLRCRGVGFVWQGQAIGEKMHFWGKQVKVKQARLVILTRIWTFDKLKKLA